MKTFLCDIKTGEIFSTTIGWNRIEGSLEHAEDWAMVIYRYSGQLKLYDIPNNNWEGRRLYQIPLPFEAETLT
jgi:hypothetical protein